MNVMLVETGSRRLRPCTVCGFYGRRVPLLVLPQQEEGRPLPKKYIRALKKQNTEVLLACGEVPKHLLPQHLLWAEGWRVQAVLVRQLLQLALKEKGLALHEAAVTVLDGGEAYTDFLLQQLAPGLNRLSLRTLRGPAFTQRAAALMEGWGLCLPLYASLANPLLQEADVVINASMDMEDLAFCLKPGAVYLDVRGNISRLRALARRREDLCFSPSVEVVWEDRCLTSAEAEALLFMGEKEGVSLAGLTRDPAAAPFLLEYLTKGKAKLKKVT